MSQPSASFSAPSRRRSRLVVLVAAVAALLFTTVSPASAQDNSDVYVVHGIPGLTVDVYVNDALTLPGFEPEAIAGPLSLPADTYQIEIFAAADDPAESADDRIGAGESPAIDQSPEVPGGLNLSVVAHLDAAGTPGLSAFVNDLSRTENGTTGRVFIRHAAAAPAVDIVAGGAPVGNLVDIENGQQEQIDLPADSYPTGIAATGSTDVLFEAPVTVRPGVGLAVYAIGDLAGGSFTVITQQFPGIALDPEYRGSSGAEGKVARLYLAMLARNPDPGGFAFWVDQVENGMSLERMVQLFEGSPEFTDRFADAKDGDTGEWVDLMYAHVLGRDADAGGRAYWIGRVDSGDLTRHDLVAFFSDSPEFRSLTGTS